MYSNLPQAESSEFVPLLENCLEVTDRLSAIHGMAERRSVILVLALKVQRPVDANDGI
jgi:hypothetical protein